MDNEIIVKQGDTKPPVRARLLDANKDPIQLENVDEGDVTFRVETIPDEEVIVDSEAEVTDPEEGKVRYEWSEGDTEKAGDFQGEFKVKFSDGEKQTVPNEGYIPVRITRQIGD